jgi:subtilisin family serine protease
MAAWNAGIVVVAAAGNSGPDAMTIGVPGNTPYVITVGSMSNNGTPNQPSDDFLAPFSSTGPTHEGFVKPDIVAPGAKLVGLAPPTSFLAAQFPAQVMKTGHFYMSGTSQSAAVISGVVALALQVNPLWTPDEVKCKVMSSGRTAVKPDGSLAYSIFQQGAGLVDAPTAVLYSNATGCANVGMDITADLAGTQHYGGPANRDADGNFYIMDVRNGENFGAVNADGYLWNTC